MYFMGGGTAMAKRYEKGSYPKNAIKVIIETLCNLIRGKGMWWSSYLEDLVLHSGASGQRRKVLHGLLRGLRLSRTGFTFADHVVCVCVCVCERAFIVHPHRIQSHEAHILPLASHANFTAMSQP